jgi:DNA-binding IclR family transcriptional regulator
MGIKTADRTLDLIELYAHEQCALTLSQISEKMGIPPSSTHGLVQTMLERGYLYELSRREGYYPTKKLERSTKLISEGDFMWRGITPYLQRLCNDISETVLLAKRQGNKVIYLDAVECNQSVRFSPIVGETKSLHCSATGKALLGALKDADLDKELAKLKLDSRTDKTITNVTKLKLEILSQRKQGWYQVIGENIPDLMSIAIPFQLNDETYVLGAGGPINRFKPLLKEHADAMLATQKQLLKFF